MSWIHVRRARRAGGAAALVAGMLLVAIGSFLPAQATGQSNNGNEGTVQIDGTSFEDFAPNNEPHVGCDFRITYYNFGASAVSHAWVVAQSPTLRPGGPQLLGNGVVVLDADGPSGAGTDFDGELIVPLDLSGITPQSEQGYHVKLTLHTTSSSGSDNKFKVFWTEGCPPPVTTTTTAPPQETTTTTAPPQETTTTTAPPQETTTTTTQPPQETTTTTTTTEPPQVAPVIVTTSTSTTVAEVLGVQFNRPPGGSNLARTGSSTGVLVALGLLLTVAGAGLLLDDRRRALGR
jgi:LPXTG-motif cell wall-anchored protein